MNDIELLNETSIWRSRDVKYVSGSFDKILKQIPEFTLKDFRMNPGDEVVNPFYRTVVRKPMTSFEREMPVGIVSNTYTLAQHREVAELCVNGLKNYGIETDDLRCELGLSELGEWMNLRIYLPEQYNYIPIDDQALALRLECFNSVEGGCRLVILFGWLRFVCSNGMIIGETVAELRDMHNRHMRLDKINDLITKGMEQVNNDTDAMQEWERTEVSKEELVAWVDTVLAKKWGKLAAFRTWYICTMGCDAKYADPFESALPSQKRSIILEKVPGANIPAKNLYDVSQTLSWIATNRNNAEERTTRQTEIPSLLRDLSLKREPQA